MEKKHLIILIVYVGLFIGAVVKMIVTGSVDWLVIASGAFCGGYGIKRVIDESTFGYIVTILCSLLMVAIIFNIRI